MYVCVYALRDSLLRVYSGSWLMRSVELMVLVFGLLWVLGCFSFGGSTGIGKRGKRSKRGKAAARAAEVHQSGVPFLFMYDERTHDYMCELMLGVQKEKECGYCDLCRVDCRRIARCWRRISLCVCLLGGMCGSTAPPSNWRWKLVRMGGHRRLVTTQCWVGWHERGWGRPAATGCGQQFTQ